MDVNISHRFHLFNTVSRFISLSLANDAIFLSTNLAFHSLWCLHVHERRGKKTRSHERTNERRLPFTGIPSCLQLVITLIIKECVLLQFAGACSNLRLLNTSLTVNTAALFRTLLYVVEFRAYPRIRRLVSSDMLRREARADWYNSTEHNWPRQDRTSILW